MLRNTKARSAKKWLLRYPAFLPVLVVLLVGVYFLRPHVIKTEARSVVSQSISLKLPSGHFYVGKNYSLKLNNASSNIKWSVSNSSVATIKKEKNNKAVLTAKKKGTVTITAVYRGITFRKQIRIYDVRITKASKKFYTGSRYKIKLKGASSKIKWSVSNKKVAAIKKGSGNSSVLTALKSGTVTVKAKYDKTVFKKKIVINKPYLSSKKLAFNSRKEQKITLKGTAASSFPVVSWSSVATRPKTAKKVYWAIENPLIISAVPNDKGIVTITPRSYGTTKIAAKYYGATYYCTVTVKASFPLETDTLSEDSLELTQISLPDDIPSYWENELSKTISLVAKREEQQGDLAKFLFFTDTHWGVNAKHSPAIVNYLTDTLHVPLTVFGGDVITTVFDDSAELSAIQRALLEINDFYSRFDSDINLLTSVGNHDTNSNGGQNETNNKKLTMRQMYLSMIKNEASFAHIYLNQLESYTDDTKHKIRYISFYYDGVHIQDLSQEKRDWVDARIKELGRGWSVVLFSHSYWKSALAGSINAPGNTIHSFARHLANLDASSNADIALWMVGHCHRDLHTVVASNDGTARLNIVSTNCDAYDRTKSERWGGEVMLYGTDTEQALDLVQLDTLKRKIYLTRIGAGRNRIYSY